MFSVVDFTLCSIALARWPQENFDLMIKIMQTSLAQGHSSINSLLRDRKTVTKEKHVKARAKQDINATKKVCLVFFSLSLEHKCLPRMASLISSVVSRMWRLP